MKYVDIENVNKAIQTTNIKGKEYAEVNQRIKAFRMLYPDGCIKTVLISNVNGICVFKAEVYSDKGEMLATGWAYEKENSTYINRTSYIENCETSAVGRALGMCGLGIDTSVASAEEVQNAQANQPIEQKYINSLRIECKKRNKKPSELEALKGVKDWYDIKSMDMFNAAMAELGAE